MLKVDSEVCLGDVLYLVGEIGLLKKMWLIIGDEVDVFVMILSGEICVECVVVINEKVFGKKICSFGIN